MSAPSDLLPVTRPHPGQAPFTPPPTVAPPAWLRRRKIWVTWHWAKKNGKWTKPPFTDGHPINAQDPKVWVSYAEAVRRVVANPATLDGIGFTLSAQDGCFGTDLDECVDPATGTISPEAQAIQARFPEAYAERTPSGTGLRLLGRGIKPPGAGCSRPWPGMRKLELYDAKRYFTFTGWHLPDSATTLGNCQAALEAFCTEGWPPKPESAPEPATASAEAAPRSDGEVMAAVTANPKVRQLYFHRDTSAYKSPSEADLYLLCRLAEQTRDPAQIARCARSAAIARDKWRELRPGGTYLSLSITEALKQTTLATTDEERELDQLNADFAQILVGGHVGILRMPAFEDKRNGKIEVLHQSDFRALLAGQRFPDWIGKNGQPQKGLEKAAWWLTHLRRRQYPEGLVFLPGQPAPPGALNLWRGFAVEPDPAPHPERRCGLFLAHVRLGLGDAALYDKCIGWAAQMVQHPDQKLLTALVFQGEQGVGKSLIGETFGKLLGPHWAKVSNARYITGQFNSHLANLLLLQAEEAFWAGDRQAEGQLKDLITSEQQLIELKGYEPVKVANYVRLLVTSNAQWVVPRSIGDRRFIVLRVTNPEHTNDWAYFGAIRHELEHGGYAALLAYLLAYDWRRGAPNLCPDTAASVEQQEQSLLSHEPPVAFLYALATCGYLPGATTGSGAISHEDLRDAYLKYFKEEGHRGQPRTTVYVRDINTFLVKHHCEPLKETRPGTDLRGTRERIHYFPPRAAICAAFVQAFKRNPEGWTKATMAQPWQPMAL